MNKKKQHLQKMKEAPESQVFGYSYGQGRLCIFFCGSKIKQKHIQSLKTFFTAARPLKSCS